MKKNISIALVKPPIRGHNLRGTGIYINHLYTYLQQDKSIDCRLLTIQEAEKWGDIMHFGYFDPFFLTLPLRKYKPTIVTIHDMIPLLFPQHFPKGIRGSIKWQLQKYAVCRTDAIITDSYTSQHDINQVLGIAEKCIFPIYLAADSNYKQIHDRNKLFSIRKKYNLPEKFVLYVGDVNWNKNIARLLRAVKQINVPLVIVSPSNEAVKIAYQEIISDKRFRIISTIAQEDLVLIYNLAAVFVMPSLYEGFGLPVVEAFQSGCPVVCSKAGSLSEIVNGSAYIIDPYKVASIANGIRNMYFNNTLQKEYRAKGLQQAKNFSWKKTAQETIAVYRRIAAHV